MALRIEAEGRESRPASGKLSVLPVIDRCDDACHRPSVISRQGSGHSGLPAPPGVRLLLLVVVIHVLGSFDPPLDAEFVHPLGVERHGGQLIDRE